MSKESAADAMEAATTQTPMSSATSADGWDGEVPVRSKRDQFLLTVVKNFAVLCGLGLLAVGIWLWADNVNEFGGRWCVFLGLVFLLIPIVRLIYALAQLLAFRYIQRKTEFDAFNKEQFGIKGDVQVREPSSSVLYYIDGLRESVVVAAYVWGVYIAFFSLLNETVSTSSGWPNAFNWISIIISVIAIFATGYAITVYATLSFTKEYTTNGSNVSMMRHLERELLLWNLLGATVLSADKSTFNLLKDDRLANDPKNSIKFMRKVGKTYARAKLGRHTIVLDGENEIDRVSDLVFEKLSSDNQVVDVQSILNSNLVDAQKASLWYWLLSYSNASIQSPREVDVLEAYKLSKVDRKAIREVVAQFVQQRRNLGKTARDARGVVNSLQGVIGGVVNMLCVLIAIGLIGVDVSSLWIAISSLLLSLSFIFGNFFKELFEATMFVFSTHAYDVGDQVFLWHEKDVFTVLRITLTNTTFMRWDGTHVVRRNVEILHEPLTNRSRCVNFSTGIVFQVDLNSISPNFVSTLKARCNEYVATLPDVFVPQSVGVTIREFEMGMHVKCKCTFDLMFVEDAGRVNGAKTGLMIALKDALHEVGAKYSGLEDGVVEAGGELVKATTKTTKTA